MPGYPTASSIITSFDTVPNFAVDYDILSVQSGPWSSGSTWNLNRIPASGEIVGIQTTHNISYDMNSSTPYKSVGIAGRLSFLTNINTSLYSQSILVYETGQLEIGNSGTPVQSSVSSQIVIVDSPLMSGSVAVPDIDPAQYGNGLLVWGDITLHGYPKSPTFLRLTHSAPSGTTSYNLESAVSGWQLNDEVVIPDTRQFKGNERFSSATSRWENREITSIQNSGTTLILNSGLIYDHSSASWSDSTYAYHPHIANLSRNIIIKSENGFGTRGHTIFFNRANVDIRYTRFHQLGRTTNDLLDSTTFSPPGVPNHIGTNQIGRYATHFHHLYGPVGGQATGRAYTLIGNVVDDPYPAAPSPTPSASKWAYTFHDSSYGLIRDCIGHHYAGAIFMTEEGSEYENLFDHNMALSSTSNRSERDVTNNIFGSAGSGFFFVGFANRVKNNVSAGHFSTFQEILSGTGYYWYWHPASTYINLPNFIGADPSINGTSTLMNKTPLLEVDNNEAYGIAGGATIWYLGTDGGGPSTMTDSYITNLVVWHCYEEGFFAYPINRLTIDGFIVVGDPTNFGNYNDAHGVGGVDYKIINFTIKNALFDNISYGVIDISDFCDTFTLRDSVIKTYSYGIQVRTPSTQGTFVTIFDHEVVIDNVLFSQVGNNPDYKKIVLSYSLGNEFTNIRVKDIVSVYNFDQIDDYNFKVYYPQQSGTFIVPSSTDSPRLYACPESGLTNLEAYVKYNPDGNLKNSGNLSDPSGLCIGGKIAPDNCVGLSGITGSVYFEALSSGSSPITTYLKNTVLDHFYGTDIYQPSSIIYVALSTTTPLINGINFTEPTAVSYSRVAVNNNKTSFSTSNNSALHNKIDINFPQAQHSWGIPTFFGIFDAPIGGNLLLFDELSKTRQVNSGTTIKFPSGSIELNAD